MRRYWPGFEWQVAWRFLREGRMQTLLIIVGVAAGVAVVAYISALIEGLQANTLAKTLGAQAHRCLPAGNLDFIKADRMFRRWRSFGRSPVARHNSVQHALIRA